MEIVFFSFAVYILICIYNLYELRLSSVLHKQKKKCIFSSLNY